MKLTPKQAQDLIRLVQEIQIPEFFEKLEKFKIKTTEVNTFKKEFIFGKYSYDFYDRLQTYINSIAHTKYDVRQPEYDIFFSFSSKNVAEAKEIVAFLRKCGVKVFFSNEDLSQYAGSSFISKINEALKTAKHFLLLCTPNSVASNYVVHECETFLRIHIESGKERRIFILEGKNFTMNLLKTVHFENIQLSKKEDIIHVLGKTTPKDNLLERLDEYQELFELFYTDQIITEKERKHLQKKQRELDLTDIQTIKIENIVREKFQIEKEHLEIERLAKQEEILWQSAKNNDITKSYQNYLYKYPNGKYNHDAKSRISQLEQIEIQNQQAELERLEIERLAKQEEILWQNAKDNDITKSYQNYLYKYPNGKYNHDAKNRISQLEQIEIQNQQAKRAEQERIVKQEETLWQSVIHTNFIVSYQSYLYNYPTGKYIFEASNKILQLRNISERISRSKERLCVDMWADVIQVAYSGSHDILWQMDMPDIDPSEMDEYTLKYRVEVLLQVLEKNEIDIKSTNIVMGIPSVFSFANILFIRSTFKKLGVLGSIRMLRRECSVILSGEANYRSSIDILYGVILRYKKSYDYVIMSVGDGVIEVGKGFSLTNSMLSSYNLEQFSTNIYNDYYNALNVDTLFVNDIDLLCENNHIVLIDNKTIIRGLVNLGRVLTGELKDTLFLPSTDNDIAVLDNNHELMNFFIGKEGYCCHPARRMRVLTVSQKNQKEININIYSVRNRKNYKEKILLNVLTIRNQKLSENDKIELSFDIDANAHISFQIYIPTINFNKTFSLTYNSSKQCIDKNLPKVITSSIDNSPFKL